MKHWSTLLHHVYGWNCVGTRVRIKKKRQNWCWEISLFSDGPWNVFSLTSASMYFQHDELQSHPTGFNQKKIHLYFMVRYKKKSYLLNVTHTFFSSFCFLTPRKQALESLIDCTMTWITLIGNSAIEWFTALRIPLNAYHLNDATTI